jgi:uncharacterized protein (DUF58 family)
MLLYGGTGRCVRQIERALQTPLTTHIQNRHPKHLVHLVTKSVDRWLNRGLDVDRSITLRVGWPLFLIPLVFFNQMLAPHPVWVVFLVTLCGLYALSYLWVRTQAPAVSLTRRRIGTILVAGDLLQEEFELHNSSPLPVLWAEFLDDSTVPGYEVGRVVACGGESFYRWRAEVLCKQRGVFRLGPHSLRLQDPLGLFVVTVVNRTEDAVLIYPRVVHLPPLQMPRGNAQGSDRQRRPLLGNLPAATISEYHTGDSLRHVHWVSTARRGRMMVKDLELEPSGNIWVVLDLCREMQQGEGVEGTLEQGVIVAASLAAELLSGRDQRAVGLLAFSGASNVHAAGDEGGLVEVQPGMGSAHLWPILTALAPVTAGELRLASLLASSRDRIGRRSTLTVITPIGDTASGSPDETPGHKDANVDVDWVAELVHLKGVGVYSSVILVGSTDADLHVVDATKALLARMEIPCSVIMAGEPLSALLTFRRRRRVVRTTPTGGVVSYEVDEEVG